MTRALVISAVLLASAALAAQQTGLDPARILKPLSEDWASYSGDYTGRRYSALRQINQSNVKNLTLAWTDAAQCRTKRRWRRQRRPYSPRGARTIVGGVGTNEYVGGTTVKGSILAVDDVLYVTAPDNVWAIDAATAICLALLLAHEGRHAHRQSRRRDVAQYSVLRHPDCYSSRSTRARARSAGTRRLASFNQQYFCTSAPTVVENT
jgi:alcohol dehydrogenase (cytochrome c)